MTNVVEVVVNEANRLVIPSAVRQQLGLSAGMTLIVEDAQSGDVVLRVTPDEPTLINKGGVIVVRAEAVGDIEQVVQNEREARLDELLYRTGK